MDGSFAAAMEAANVGVNKRSTDAVVFVDRSVVDRSASPLLMTLDGWAFFLEASSFEASFVLFVDRTRKLTRCACPDVLT